MVRVKLLEFGSMKGEKLKIRIRRILFPILFCLAVACIIELPLAQTTIFGDDVILWDTLFRSVIAVPMLVHLYREDSVFREKNTGTEKSRLRHFSVAQEYPWRSALR